MRLFQRVQNRLVRWQYGRLERHLRTASPQALAAESERRLLKAFHRAARHVPAYKRILRERGVNPIEITTVKDFRRRVPILCKEEVFCANELRDLCVGGDPNGVSLFYSSSGHSGVFSFGVETRADATAAGLATEFALHVAARVLDRKTLLINCLPMGIRIHTRTLPVAETGLRPDSVWALVTKLKDDFQQFVLVCEQPFLKKTIEEGAEHGVPWRDLVVHVVTGAEYMAENFRTYLASLLGTDFDAPEEGMIVVNFGLSELSSSIFQENAHTIRIRRQAHRDPRFREALYGRQTPICPSIMQYYPRQTYIETVPGKDGRSELVVSMLDPTLKIPLIRYNTRDVVETMAYDRLAGILSDFRCDESLLPPFRLPIGVIWGKLQPLATEGGASILSESVKEILYSNAHVADKITGNFRLMEKEGTIRLLVQLRRGKGLPQDLAGVLAKNVRDSVGQEVQVQVVPFIEFSYGLEHDFQRKNEYLGGTVRGAGPEPQENPE